MYVSDVESYMMDWDWETNKKNGYNNSRFPRTRSMEMSYL